MEEVIHGFSTWNMFQKDLGRFSNNTAPNLKASEEECICRY